MVVPPPPEEGLAAAARRRRRRLLEEEAEEEERWRLQLLEAVYRPIDGFTLSSDAVFGLGASDLPHPEKSQYTYGEALNLRSYARILRGSQAAARSYYVGPGSEDAAAFSAALLREEPATCGGGHDERSVAAALDEISSMSDDGKISANA